ncbi:hypothetical protein Glove_99g334 [Diversispora epigaea]|uniref:Methyltransferase domain-containing protein n=1 Tax=Diversispora epigaea TaxID=1348612 RepID=A0A397JET8_9GLOM|nr:hypothetical protein Glove_99g334 [Diversispora epigaea]
MGKAYSKTVRHRSKSHPTLPDPHIHEVINRRKYSSSYALPLDNDEVDRLTLQHYIFCNIWGGNFSSPVENILTNGAKVLDVGCGPGVFSLELANRYPRSSFTGVDIVNNYPQSIKPENTTFIKSNVTDGLPFADNSFDFVYMRFMMLAFTLKNWPRVINELTRVCKPGGWIEVMERDILWFNEGEGVRNWRTKIVEGMREKGIELIISPYIPNFFRANEQLINFKSDERIEPLGAWAGIIGKAYSQVIMWGAKNLTHAVSGIEFEEGEYGELINVAMDELDRNKSFDKSHRFWAMKKPLTKDASLNY